MRKAGSSKTSIFCDLTHIHNQAKQNTFAIGEHSSTSSDDLSINFWSFMPKGIFALKSDNYPLSLFAE